MSDKGTQEARQVGPYRHDVVGAVLVSTILRESSAMEYRSPYFETMAFPVEGKPAILWQSSAGYEREADRQHDLAVRWFSRESRRSVTGSLPGRVCVTDGTE
jgi:hypothetical protein